MIYTVKSSRYLNLICLCLIGLVILSACSTKPQEDPVGDHSVTELSSERSSTAAKGQGGDEPSDQQVKLRIYWQKRDSYNPLDTFDYSGRAVFQLVFRPLFCLDDANILRGDLVKSVDYVEEKATYELELNKGIAFSNNQLISSADCKASILAYRDYLRAFMNQVSQGLPNDDQTLDSEGVQKGNLGEYLDQDLLKAELDRLDLIQDIKIIDDSNFQIILPEGYAVVNPVELDQPQPSASLTFTESFNDWRNKARDKDQNEDEHRSKLDAKGDRELKADPGLLFALTMPIVPENQVNQADFPQLSSAGYVFDKQDTGEIVLKARNRSARLKAVHLLAYRDADAAMEALTAGDLDLVYLTEDKYYSYGKQNFQKLVSFPSQRYYYINFGKNKTIRNPQLQTAIKQIWQVRDDLTQFLTGYQTINRLPLQLNDAAISNFQLFSDQDEVNLTKLDIGKDIELKILLPKSKLLEDWALDLREKLLSLNIDLDIESLDPLAYQEAINSGDYDLAICWLNLAYPMAVEDSFYQIRPEIWKNMDDAEKILASQLHQYFYLPGRAFDPKLLDDNLNNYRNFILNSYQNLNVLGIGFEQAGIVFGQKVEGSTKSRINFPYADLEGLWVWP